MELGLKFALCKIAIDARLQPVERRHQGLGHIAAAESAVAAAGIGIAGGRRSGCAA